MAAPSQPGLDNPEGQKCEFWPQLCLLQVARSQLFLRLQSRSLPSDRATVPVRQVPGATRSPLFLSSLFDALPASPHPTLHAPAHTFQPSVLLARPVFVLAAHCGMLLFIGKHFSLQVSSQASRSRLWLFLPFFISLL